MKLEVELPDNALTCDTEKIESIIYTEMTKSLMFVNLINLGWRNSFVKNVKGTGLKFVWFKNTH